VAHIIETLTPEKARSIGEAARKRVLAEHTYTQRGKLVQQHLQCAMAENSAAAVEFSA
jgi:lactam utilization protein B